MSVDVSYLDRAPQMVDAGLKVVGFGPDGRATMVMPARADWLGDTARGRMHPGAITVLADTACGLAVRCRMDRQMPVATLDLRMNYLSAGDPGRELHCEAECHRLTSEIGFVRATLWQDDRAQPVADAQATFIVIGPAGRPSKASGPVSQPAPDGAGLEAASSAASGSASEVHGERDHAWLPAAASEPLSAEHAAPYARYLGVRCAQSAAGTLYRLPFAPKLVGNPALPAIHGGVIAGFAETAATLRLMQAMKEPSSPDGRPAFPKSIDFSIDYLRSGRPQETFAECEVVRVGSRVALVRVRVWQTSPDHPIAVARAHLLLPATQAQVVG